MKGDDERDGVGGSGGEGAAVHRRDVLGRPLREVRLHDAGQGLDDEDASEVGLEQDVLLVAAAHRVLLGVEEEELWVDEPQQVELELLEV